MELLGLSILTPSGGSYRTTVPVSIPRDLWGKGREPLPVCFVKENNRVLLVPFDDLMSGEYPESLKEKALEEWSRKIFGQRFYTQMKAIMERLAKGDISSREFWDELERNYRTMVERIRPHVSRISGSLAFADELESLILSATLAEEEIRAREFQELSETLSEIIARRDRLTELLNALKSRDDVEDDVREFVESRIVFELEMINEGIERIRSSVCKL